MTNLKATLFTFILCFFISKKNIAMSEDISTSDENKIVMKLTKESLKHSEWPIDKLLDEVTNSNPININLERLLEQLINNPLYLFDFYNMDIRIPLERKIVGSAVDIEPNTYISLNRSTKTIEFYEDSTRTKVFYSFKIKSKKIVSFSTDMRFILLQCKTNPNIYWLLDIKLIAKIIIRLKEQKEETKFLNFMSTISEAAYQYKKSDGFEETQNFQTSSNSHIPDEV